MDVFVDLRFLQTEIPQFLSDEECEHIISLAKESGLSMSIAGFDRAAYEGDLDEDMAEAGKIVYSLCKCERDCLRVMRKKKKI